MTLKLVIGNKAYSSWSMRPWILMRAFDIAFDEVVVPLQTAETTATLLRYSPAAKVPVLVEGGTHVWDSLAIVEYLAETRPHLWPADKDARAMARALSAEMHSGFSALRRAYPMNMRRAPRRRELGPEIEAEVMSDVARIEGAWVDARARFGAGGPFLFGSFCAADAMFAPVANRFYAYDVVVGETARAYMAAIFAFPAWRDWQAGADAEGWRIDKFEMI